MKSIFFPRSVRMFGAALVAAAVIAFSIPLFAHAMTITRQLDLGMSGSDVSAVQTFLASDATLYPEGLVTGYYGGLTKAAIQRFQARNNIVSSGTPATTGYGRVGPSTMAVLNAQMGNNTGVNTGGAPILSNISISAGTNNATVSFNTNELARSQLYYSAAPLNVTESLNDVAVSGANVVSVNPAMNTSHSISFSGLQSNTLYYYMVYTTDDVGNVTVSSPSTFRTNQ